MTNPLYLHNRITLSSPPLFARLILCLFAFALVAGAASSTFVLVGATATDGSTLSGSFDFDPVTNAYSNINIVIAGGSSPATTFTTASFLVFPANPNIVQLLPTAVDQTGNLTLVLIFTPVLPALASIAGSPFGFCINPACTATGSAIGAVTAGTLQLSVLPDFFLQWFFLEG